MADQLGGASGNATSAQLLEGYTASNAQGPISGAIPIVSGGAVAPSTTSQTAVNAATYVQNAVTVDAIQGTATTADVLPSVTFSSGTVVNEAGTMPVNSGTTYQPGQHIKAGFDDGSSVVASPGSGSQTFTSSGTFTVRSGVTRLLVEMWGSGGGGGGGTPSTYYGGGGGGGAYILALVDVSPLSSIPVTIGVGGAGGAQATAGSPGGSTIFGTLSAGGGQGGQPQTGSSNGASGAGGIAPTSGVLIGYNGADSGSLDGGISGSTVGPPGTASTAPALPTGNYMETSGSGGGYSANGASPGGGGGGGGFINSIVSNGGNGANGLVIVRW